MRPPDPHQLGPRSRGDRNAPIGAGPKNSVGDPPILGDNGTLASLYRFNQRQVSAVLPRCLKAEMATHGVKRTYAGLRRWISLLAKKISQQSGSTKSLHESCPRRPKSRVRPLTDIDLAQRSHGDRNAQMVAGPKNFVDKPRPEVTLLR